MDDLNEMTADVLELLVLDQSTLGAAIEELSNWIRDQGGIEAHANIVGPGDARHKQLQRIASMIRVLRR